MKVIIVDDEPKAIELLSGYLSHFANFTLIKTFRNGLKALEFLNRNTIDVIFLDINMPHLSGLSLSKMISSNTAIVFTTAYSEHALESYDVSAIDYLLKPISLERFSKTITKLIDRFEKPSNTLESGVTPEKTIFIKSGLEIHQLKINEIEYLKKEGNYMFYMIQGKKIMARQSIAEALQQLDTNFIQIQKSYVVNFRKITAIASDYVTLDTIQLPIGLRYKSELAQKIDS